MKNLISTVAIICLTACASGPADDAVLADLDHDTWHELCEAYEVEAHTMTCNDVDTEMDAYTVEDCAEANEDAWTDCTATVADFRACNDAMSAMDMCEMDPMMPEACTTAMATCMGR